MEGATHFAYFLVDNRCTRCFRQSPITWREWMKRVMIVLMAASFCGAAFGITMVTQHATLPGHD